MIIQHLLLRCKRGYYPSTTLAGLKTAAISNGFSVFSPDFQRELEKEISLAILPDGVKLSERSNRGILRITYYDDVLLISRIFRVADLCDYRGNSNFTHTYIVDEVEREKILNHPECLSNLNAYDNYNDIDIRCGGLRNENSIEINTDLTLVDTSYHFEEDIFAKFKITKTVFSKIISELCNVLSGEGHISIILPGVDENTWDDEGGSLVGEIFMLSILKLLPDCLARFFSGISYWNESDSFYGIEDIKFRIVSGRFTDYYYNGGCKVFDLCHNYSTPNTGTSEFGDFLWDIKNDPQKLNDFNNFINQMFGENIDSIVKPARLMNAITRIYKNPVEDDDIDTQNTICELLSMLGSNIDYFPGIFEYCLKGFEHFSQNKFTISRELENLIVSYNIISDKIRQPVIKCLINNIIQGCSGSGAVDYISKVLISVKDSYAENVFKSQIEQIITNGISSVSNSMIQLMTVYYNEASYDIGLLSRIFNIFNTTAEEYYRKEQFSEYLNVMDVIFRTEKSIDLASNKSIREWYLNTLPRIVEICISDEKLEKQAERIMFNHFDIISGRNDSIKLCTEYENIIFHSNTTDTLKLFQHTEIFRLYSVLFPFIVDNEYARESWLKLYLFLLNTNYTLFCNPDIYLDNLNDEIKVKILLMFEGERIKCTGKTSWQRISAIIDCEPKRINKIQIIKALYNEGANKSEVLRDMSNSGIIYGFLLFVFDEDLSNGSKPSEIVAKANCVIEKDDCLDRFLSYSKEVHREKTLSIMYYSLWNIKQKKENRLPKIPDDNTVELVKDVEDKLKPFKYKEKVMTNFCHLFLKCFSKDKIVSLGRKTVKYINYCRQNYYWDNFGDGINIIIQRMLDLRETIDVVIYEQKLSPEIIKELFNNDYREQKYLLCNYIIKFVNEQTKNVGNELDTNVLLLVFYIMKFASRDGDGESVEDFLKILRAETGDWREIGYLLRGLSILCDIFEVVDEYNTDLIDGFLNAFVKTVFKHKYVNNSEKTEILKYKDIYEKRIKYHLNSEQLDQLGEKFSKTRDEELMQMFPKTKKSFINKFLEYTNRISGKRNGNKQPQKVSEYQKGKRVNCTVKKQYRKRSDKKLSKHGRYKR